MNAVASSAGADVEQGNGEAVSRGSDSRRSSGSGSSKDEKKKSAEKRKKADKKSEASLKGMRISPMPETEDFFDWNTKDENVTPQDNGYVVFDYNYTFRLFRKRVSYFTECTVQICSVDWGALRTNFIFL
jgi:hypothetical protein